MWSIRINPARAALALLATLPLLISCRLNGTDREQAYFTVEGDSALTGYSRVVILLCDGQDHLIDTLYDDSLPSLDRLQGLPADSYGGGPARIKILGYRDGKLVHGETRVYDGDSQRVLALEPLTADTVVGPPSSDPKVPVLSAVTSDSAVSIRDSVALTAQVFDSDGDLQAYSWNCDGKDRDSTMIYGYRWTLSGGDAFPDSGSHSCELKVWDRAGHSARARRSVRVEWDPPVAHAGDDTTVMAGTRIMLHAKGEDRFGPIVSREWSVDGGPWKAMPSQETQANAGDEAGVMVFVLRITDSDGLTGLDTLLVTVLPAN
jgi:hypothetical protein